MTDCPMRGAKCCGSGTRRADDGTPRQHRAKKPPPRTARERSYAMSPRLGSDQTVAALSLASGRILTRTLAGLAAPGTIWPVDGLRMSVPALRAGTLRSEILSRP